MQLQQTDRWKTITAPHAHPQNQQERDDRKLCERWKEVMPILDGDGSGGNDNVGSDNEGLWGLRTAAEDGIGMRSRRDIQDHWKVKMKSKLKT